MQNNDTFIDTKNEDFTSFNHNCWKLGQFIYVSYKMELLQSPFSMIWEKEPWDQGFIQIKEEIRMQRNKSTHGEYSELTRKKKWIVITSENSITRK